MSKHFLDVSATVRDDGSITIYRAEAGSHLVLHDTYRDTQKSHDELQAWSVATIKRDNEIAQLRATITEQAERIAALEQAARDARHQLRATSENWREACLYSADDILPKAIGDEPREKPEHDAAAAVQLPSTGRGAV